MEHEIGPKHVDDVGESPRYLLRHARNYVEEDLEANDEDEVYGPGTYYTGLCVSSGNLVGVSKAEGTGQSNLPTFCIDPLRIQVRQS